MAERARDAAGEGYEAGERMARSSSGDGADGSPGERSRASEGSEDDAAEPEPNAEEGWLEKPWYQSGVGIGVVLTDVLLTIVLVATTTVQLDGTVVDIGLQSGRVPWYIYAFGILGALGFVFTTLIEDFDRSTFDVIHYNLRLPAALPLGVGIYLFSDILLGEAVTEDFPLVVGLVFLSGMYVNLAYRQLSTLAQRLLPASEDEPEERNGGEGHVNNGDGGADGVDPESVDDGGRGDGTGDDE